LEHDFYPYGNSEKISWVIKTENSVTEQTREHVDIYKDIVSNTQSKYIALHVGLFWGIGTFLIKNNDVINVKLDELSMYDHLVSKRKSDDGFIEKRKNFINQLALQRNLKIKYELINSAENLAVKIT